MALSARAPLQKPLGDAAHAQPHRQSHPSGPRTSTSQRARATHWRPLATICNYDVGGFDGSLWRLGVTPGRQQELVVDVQPLGCPRVVDQHFPGVSCCGFTYAAVARWWLLGHARSQTRARTSWPGLNSGSGASPAGRSRSRTAPIPPNWNFCLTSTSTSGQAARYAVKPPSATTDSKGGIPQPMRAALARANLAQAGDQAFAFCPRSSARSCSRGSPAACRSATHVG